MPIKPGKDVIVEFCLGDRCVPVARAGEEEDAKGLANDVHPCCMPEIQRSQAACFEDFRKKFNQRNADTCNSVIDT